jgi:hypothetical protein
MVRRAELSSLVSSLEDLSRRVTALAEQAQESRDEEMASELFSVERSMTAALRRLRRTAGA